MKALEGIVEATGDRSAPRPAAAGTVPEAIAVLLVWLGSAMLLGGLLGKAPADISGPSLLLLALAPYLPASAFLFALLARRHGAAGAIRALGLGERPTLRPLREALGRYALFAPFLFLAGILWGLLLESLFGMEGSVVLDRILEGSPGALPLVLAGAVLVGPFFEELLFRGYLQGSLSSRYGARAGLALAAGVWALGHEVVAWFPIFLFGVFLGSLFRRRGALLVVFGVHAFHNALSMTLFALVR